MVCFGVVWVMYRNHFHIPPASYHFWWAMIKLDGGSSKMWLGNFGHSYPTWWWAMNWILLCLGFANHWVVIQQTPRHVLTYLGNLGNSFARGLVRPTWVVAWKKQQNHFSFLANFEVGKKIPFVRELGGETFLRRMLSKKRQRTWRIIPLSKTNSNLSTY